MPPICQRTMTKLLSFSFLLVFWFSTRVNSNIHSLLRDLDESEHEQRRGGLPHDTHKLDEYRKMLIKEEILSRLGLSNPPNISGNSFVPKQIIENVLLQRTREDEEITKDANAYYGVTKQVVVMAEREKPSDSATPGTHILRFHTDYSRRSITSVLLGFHRDPRVLSNKILKKDGSILVRTLDNDQSIPYRPAHVVKIDHNWIILNITKESWNFGNEDDSVKNISVQVVCELCGDKTFMWNSEKNHPFLVANVRPANRKRVARSSECSGNGKKCCLVQYVVKFAELGWGDWIIAPDRIYLNYCKGSCRSVLNTNTNPEHIFMQRLTRPSNRAPFNEPCCVVTKMASVSLLFKTGSGIYEIRKKDVPNMRAVECECT